MEVNMFQMLSIFWTCAYETHNQTFSRWTFRSTLNIHIKVRKSRHKTSLTTCKSIDHIFWNKNLLNTWINSKTYFLAFVHRLLTHIWRTLNNFWHTLWQLLDHWRTPDKFLTSFWPISDQVWLTSDQFLTNFWQTSDQLLTNFWPTSERNLINVWPISDQFLTNFWPTSDQLMINLLPISD